MAGQQPPPLGFKERLACDQARLREAFAAQDRGETVDWDAFRSSFSIRVSPHTWNELVAILADGSDEAMASLGRSPSELKAYWNFSEKVIKAQFASATDYLYCKVFGVPAQERPGGKKAAVLPPDFSDRLRVVWRPNDFPYSFEPGIEHHNVWANRPLSLAELEQVIAENREGWETLHYINPRAVMSVPGIWHAHVLSRRRPS